MESWRGGGGLKAVEGRQAGPPQSSQTESLHSSCGLLASLPEASMIGAHSLSGRPLALLSTTLTLGEAGNEAWGQKSGSGGIALSSGAVWASDPIGTHGWTPDMGA